MDYSLQPRSHPLKWKWLIQCVEESGMENPDVWIEDLRWKGPCSGVERTVVCREEETDGVKASFSVICDVESNRLVIRHHY